MLYLYVTKNPDDSFKIVRVITSHINQRGNSGITYGDISILDVQTRKDEGFWTQTDVYSEQGEYMMFKDKVTAFDEATLTVTNTYNYERMNLDDIRNDLKQRVDSKRNEMYYGSFTFEGVEYLADRDSRMNIIGTQAAVLTDPTAIPQGYFWRAADDSNVPMDAEKFKAFAMYLFQYSTGIYHTAWMIKTALDNATTYEELRAAAEWANTPL